MARTMARAKRKEAPSVNTSLVILPPPPPRGRPSLYTEELAAEICSRIAVGETLTAICEDEDMPDRVTVWRWLGRPDFSQLYARAREAQADFEADEIKQIADDCTDDVRIDYDKDGKPVVKIDADAIRRAQLRIETRKWRAERLNRRQWGANIKHEHALTPDPAHDPERLPAGLDWLAGAIEGGRDEPEQRDSGVGET